MTDCDYALLRSQLDALLANETDALANTSNFVALLFNALQGLNWLGVYVRRDDELVLGPFQGQPACVRIPIGKGICGAAVQENRTVVVPDVSEDQRYLACSLETRSEIVVPITQLGYVFGEIDIDSHTPDAFGEQDRLLLEEVARKLTPLFS